MHKRMSPHEEFDYMGEAIKLVENFNVENVIFNCDEFNDLERDLIEKYNSLRNDTNKVHYEVGSKIRKTIKELGGIMTENLLTLKKFKIDSI